MSAKTPEAAAGMAADIKAPVLAAAHQDHTARILAQTFGLQETMCCRQPMWEGLEPPVVPASEYLLRILNPDAEDEILSV